MSNITKIIGAMLAFFWMSSPAAADGHMVGNWSLSASESKVSFGSIKKGKVGEVHHFKNLSGKVSSEGKVEVAIDLSSVETLADIRNERMVKFVFDAAHPKAILNASFDPKQISQLKSGETKTLSISGTLVLNGKSIPVETDMFIARLADNKMMVSTDAMIMLSMEDAGIDAGITKLMELAKLPSIARTSPVVLRLVFSK